MDQYLTCTSVLETKDTVISSITLHLRQLDPHVMKKPTFYDFTFCGGVSV
jgi:hypothetical protein